MLSLFNNASEKHSCKFLSIASIYSWDMYFVPPESGGFDTFITNRMQQRWWVHVITCVTILDKILIASLSLTCFGEASNHGGKIHMVRSYGWQTAISQETAEAPDWGPMRGWPLPTAALGQEIDGFQGRQLKFSFYGLIFQDENSRTIGGGGRALPRQKIRDHIFLILSQKIFLTTRVERLLGVQKGSNVNWYP